MKGKVTDSFNPRRGNYDNDDFPDDLFPNNIFPEGRTAAQITTARNAARTNAVNVANGVAADGDKKNFIKGIWNNAPFINCISKINRALIDNAEDLDVAMPMYNFFEYSKNYSKTTGSLWNYYRDEPTSDGEINYYLGSKSFDFKSSIMGKLGDTSDDNQAGKDEISLVIPFKHLSNFWKSLKMPLINCEIELILTWSKNCVVLSSAKRDAIAATGLRARSVSDAKAAIMSQQQMQHFK